MDFTFSEDQRALGELAARIFTGSSPTTRVTEVERTPERFDRDLWRQLAEANLLGVAIPERWGGLGYGLVELALLLIEQGRRVAPVPLVPTLAMAALPIVEFGTDAQRNAWLPRIAGGSTVLTAAYSEWGANDPLRPSVRAEPHGSGWRLTGTKPAVPTAAVAEAAVVPARTPEGDIVVALVELAQPGVELALSDTTNRERHATMTLDAVAVDADGVLGSPADGAAIVAWAVARTQVALSAVVLGCGEEATRLAAAHTNTREQFGRPLSTNQGVALRMADCAIDLDGIRVALWSAAWRIDAGLPADDAVLVAKWWSAEAGQRVVHNTQHLHGGTGADVDHPVHRYFLWVKQIENTLGGGSAQLARLGESIARRARQEATACS